MFRMWGKIWQDNHLLNDLVIVDTDMEKSRTKKVFDSLEEICYAFDLSKPIWLDGNIQEFKRVAKTRFGADNFIDSISFDFLEIQIIEEDD